MKRPILIAMFFVAALSQSYCQVDSLATIHFYSAKPAQGQVKSFEILEGTESLAVSDGGLEILHRCFPGSYTFSLKNSSSTVTIPAQIGGEYFVEILLDNVQTFKLKSKAAGEEDLKKLRGDY